MLCMGDLIIIAFLVGACCLFIFIIIVVRRILLCRYDNKQQKSDSFCKFLVKNEEKIVGNYFSAQKSNAFFIHDQQTKNVSSSKEMNGNQNHLEMKTEMHEVILNENSDVLDGITGKSKAVVTKAISCDSILSDIEVSHYESMRMGQLEFALNYNRETSELSVSIIQARDLEKDEIKGSVISFVQVWIIPRNQGKFQTQIYESDDCPRYMEKFFFNVPGCEFELQTLKFQVLSPDSKFSGENKILGEAELKLGDVLGLIHPFKVWLNLHELNYEPPDCGDILFSMSYLPTAERLTLIIIKARNLKWPAEFQITECFVKVHVLQNSRRIQKKKTSNKKDECNPIYNESMTFLVPATSLQSLQLRVTVMGCLQQGRQYQVGHVTVGPKVTGTELLHWNQILNSLRRQTSMWHCLRR